MASSQVSDVIQQLRRTVFPRDGAGPTDGQLLADYINHRDGAALAALVWRHGPMVWGVCRRVLRSHHDAEDAFQATFLVLVRKAASIASRELLANWLYGVAQQTALKARETVAKRKGRERHVTEMPEPAAAEQDLWHDLHPVLDEELGRLPGKYRSVIVLCELEGKTRNETAGQLGVPPGTVAGWLARARTMLAKRLARRGVMLSGGTLAAVLSQNASAAGVPSAVASSTINALTSAAAGQASSGLISAKVVALTEGVLKTMLLKQLKALTAILLALGAVVAYGGGLLLTHYSEAAQQHEKPTFDAKEGKRKSLTNSLGMRFVWIPPGNFMMGSPKEEVERKANETQHKVMLSKGFYMGIHLVTQEEWQSVMGNNPSTFEGDKTRPVETICWDECQEFIKKLQAKDAKPYRLPTEAEWEYACRAGTTTPFHFGATISTDQANYNGNFVYGNGKKGHYRRETTPVGSFPANAWGLYDMHGNSFQWCQDWYGEYPQRDAIDPQGPDAGTERVLRGSSWASFPDGCRSAWRSRYEPGKRLSSHGGFRLCFSKEAEKKAPKESTKGASPDETAKDPSPKPASPAVGKRVPGFWTHNAGGQITHIDDKWLREKWVLVEFWSSQDRERNKDQARLETLRKHFLAEDRLLMFSVCVDLELEEWMKYVSSQKDLELPDGARAEFFSDKRWWQLSLGVNRAEETHELIAGYGLQAMPQYFLIRPDETLAVGHIPKDALKDVLTEHLGNANGPRPPLGTMAR